jgi:hypothetical protein
MRRYVLKELIGLPINKSNFSDNVSVQFNADGTLFHPGLIKMATICLGLIRHKKFWKYGDKVKKKKSGSRKVDFGEYLRRWSEVKGEKTYVFFVFLLLNVLWGSV